MVAPSYSTAVRYFENTTYGINMALNGSSPNISFDLTPPNSYLYKVYNVKFSFITPFPSSDMVRYDRFMNNTSLSNGILVQDTQLGQVTFTATIQDNSDMAILPVAEWYTTFKANGNALIEVRFDFNPYTPLILSHRYNDFNRITIRDDLSFMTLFTASSRGILVRETGDVIPPG